MKDDGRVMPVWSPSAEKPYVRPARVSGSGRRQARRVVHAKHAQRVRVLLLLVLVLAAGCSTLPCWQQAQGSLRGALPRRPQHAPRLKKTMPTWHISTAAMKLAYLERFAAHQARARTWRGSAEAAGSAANEEPDVTDVSSSVTCRS